MAEQTVHDVVKQPRSADAPSSADDSATKTFDPAVRAAAANIVSTDRNSNLSNLPLDEKIRAGSQHNTGAVDLELSASQEEVTVRTHEKIEKSCLNVLIGQSNRHRSCKSGGREPDI